jgi:hypothetical protein
MAVMIQRGNKKNQLKVRKGQHVNKEEANNN